MNTLTAALVMLAGAGYLFVKLKPMKVDQAGIDLIKSFEGFSQVPYDDANGQSIGYGHFILEDEKDALQFVTPEQAEQLLRRDVAIAEAAVNETIKVAVTQSMFNAMVSLAYNIGGGAFAKSTLANLVNAGNFAAARDEFQRWVYSQGNINSGLVSRRAKEASIFLS